MLTRLRFLRMWVVVLVVVGASASPSLTRAQNEQIQANFKGAVGVGLVGAELGAVIPALAGMDATWPYLVFPAIGAAGGAVAGYFLLDNADRVDLSIAALTAGIGLIIPTLIATLQLTAYDDGVEDEEPPPGTYVRRGAGAERPERPSNASRSHRRTVDARQAALGRIRRRLAAGPGMVRVSDGRLALAAPGVSLLPGTGTGNAVSGLSVALMSGQF